MIKKSIIILLITCPLTSYSALQAIKEATLTASRQVRNFSLLKNSGLVVEQAIRFHQLNTLPVANQQGNNHISSSKTPPIRMFSCFAPSLIETYTLTLFKDFRIKAHIDYFPFLRDSFPEWDDLIRRLSAVFHIVDVYSSRKQLHHLKENWFQQEWKEVEKLWYMESHKVDMNHKTLAISEKIDRGFILMKILLERGK